MVAIYTFDEFHMRREKLTDFQIQNVRVKRFLNESEYIVL